MPTGVAPSAASILLVMRVGARSLSPLRSASCVTGRLARKKWPGSCTWKASGLTSLNSPAACCLGVVPDGAAGRLGRGHHEGQLEHLDQREAARGVAEQGPHHVGDAILRLVVELARRAAELHRRIDLALEATAGILGQPVAPGSEDLGVGRRGGRQEVMDAERDLLGKSRRRQHGEGEQAGRRTSVSSVAGGRGERDAILDDRHFQFAQAGDAAAQPVASAAPARRRPAYR